MATYASGLLVAGGADGTVVSSVNGQDWEPRPAPFSYPLLGLTFGDGTFLAASFSGALLQSDRLETEILAPVLTLHWTLDRRAQIEFPSQNGVRYTLFTSEGSNGWTPGTQLTGDGNTIVHLDEDSGLHPWRLYRVAAEKLVP